MYQNSVAFDILLLFYTIIFQLIPLSLVRFCTHDASLFFGIYRERERERETVYAMFLTIWLAVLMTPTWGEDGGCETNFSGMFCSTLTGFLMYTARSCGERMMMYNQLDTSVTLMQTVCAAAEIQTWTAACCKLRTGCWLAASLPRSSHEGNGCPGSVHSKKLSQLMYMYTFS